MSTYDTFVSERFFRVQKIHTCVLCAGVCRYEVSRLVSETARSREAAEARAHRSEREALWDEFEPHPCPTCGLLQPEMLGSERHLMHTFQLMALGTITLVLGSLAYTHTLHLSTRGYASFGLFGGLAAVAMSTATGDPRHRCTNGLKLAKREIANGELSLVQSGDPQALLSRSLAATMVRPSPQILGLLVGAMVLCLAPEAWRIFSGARHNASWFPAVVGPGDTARYYFDAQIHSLKGFWRGSVRISILSEEGDDLFRCEASTQDNDWGKRIGSVRQEEKLKSTIHADVHLPETEPLVNSLVPLSAVVHYEHPVVVDAARFEVRQAHLSEHPELALASSGAGARYQWFGWLGFVGASVAMGMGRGCRRCVGRPSSILRS